MAADAKSVEFKIEPKLERPVNERTPGMSYQDIVKADYVRAPDGGVPAVLRPVVDFKVPTTDVSYERYTSGAWFEREMTHLWPRVWQMACREEQLPRVGSFYVYDIGRYSLILVRTDLGIKAYHNSCLHRGTKLKPSGSKGYTEAKLRCPFHGWTWKLDGALEPVPCAWEFEHLNYEANRLPEAQVAVWNSLVFINMDLNAKPLMDYLEIMPEHFSHWWPFDDWVTSVHVEKELNCNWKTAQEAFMEAYHTPVVHPELTRVVGDWNMQHDIYGPHTSRDLCAMAVQSPTRPPDMTEEEMLETRLAGGPQEKRGGRIPPGQKARSVIAARMRDDARAKYGRDLSNLSDAEMIDSLKYNLFPNLIVYGGPGLPQIQRVRPLGEDPHRCVLEFISLQPVLPGESRPKPASVVRITEADSYKDVPGIDAFNGKVLDQDTQILRWQHEGMRASKKGAETLSSYQESRIRHFHSTLDRYVRG